MYRKETIFNEGYCSPVVKLVSAEFSGALCSSYVFSVNPTEVDTADRNVYQGGSYDSLD